MFKDFPDLHDGIMATDEEWQQDKEHAGYCYKYNTKSSKLTKEADVCT